MSVWLYNVVTKCVCYYYCPLRLLTGVPGTNVLPKLALCQIDPVITPNEMTRNLLSTDRHTPNMRQRNRPPDDCHSTRTAANNNGRLMHIDGTTQRDGHP